MTDVTQALSASMENYLETILLIVREHAVARSKEIADRLRVSRSSVTGALQALRERGLVNYEPYGVVTLTSDGTSIAGRVLRRHGALREFMVEVLSIDPDAADKAACHMEHGISKHIVDRFVELADYFKNRPSAQADWVKRRGTC